MYDIILNVFIFVIGLSFLIYGSNFLIQSCVKLAFLFKLTPFFIGIIFVAFGTSTPELAVGIMAAIKNQKTIALGTIIGSNIANIGFILGLCSLLRPFNISKSILKKELPIMIFSVVLLYLLSWDLVLNRVDGLIFLVFFGIFCFISYRKARVSPKGLQELSNFDFKNLFKKLNSKLLAVLLSIFFIGLVILGANLMVSSGVNLAEIFGVSPWIIAITVFAIGTSLPELAASLSATFKKVPSIGVGNIIGSNIFNILLILGIVSLLRPITIINSSILIFELPVLIIFSLGLLIVMRTDYRMNRWEGLLLFLGYTVFLFFLLRK